MKRLYVGCRVRVVCPESDRHGYETRVLGLDVTGEDFDGRLFLGVWVDLHGEADTDDGRWVFEAHELEPIVDDLNKVIEWADMADLWTPSGVEA